MVDEGLDHTNNVGRKINRKQIRREYRAPGQAQRMLGRQAFVRLQSATRGTITLGCHYDSVVNTIAHTTSDITASNNALSIRADEHAASIEQTSASMEQLASTVKANADHTQQARACNVCSRKGARW